MCAKKLAPDPIYILRGAGSSLSYLKFKNNSLLLSANYNGDLQFWSLESYRVIDKISVHPGYSVLWIDIFGESGDCILTQGREGLVKIWQNSQSQWIQSGDFKSNSMGFCASCYLGDSVLALPSTIDSCVDICDLKTARTISSLKCDGKTGMCMNIKMVDNRKVLIGYEDGSIALWDLKTNKMVDKLNVHKNPVMGMDYSDVLKCGFSGSTTEELCSWTKQDDKVCICKTVNITNPGVNDVLLRKDGKIVVFAGWDNCVRVFSCKQMKALAILKYHKQNVRCLAFSSGNILACGSQDECISLWDIYK